MSANRATRDHDDDDHASPLEEDSGTSSVEGGCGAFYHTTTELSAFVVQVVPYTAAINRRMAQSLSLPAERRELPPAALDLIDAHRDLELPDEAWRGVAMLVKFVMLLMGGTPDDLHMYVMGVMFESAQLTLLPSWVDWFKGRVYRHLCRYDERKLARQYERVMQAALMLAPALAPANAALASEVQVERLTPSPRAARNPLTREEQAQEALADDANISCLTQPNRLVMHMYFTQREPLPEQIVACVRTMHSEYDEQLLLRIASFMFFLMLRFYEMQPDELMRVLVHALALRVDVPWPAHLELPAIRQQTGLASPKATSPDVERFRAAVDVLGPVVARQVREIRDRIILQQFPNMDPPFHISREAAVGIINMFATPP